MKKYSLNLSRDYVPNWTLNEVVREIGSNYRDSEKSHEVRCTEQYLQFVSEADPGLDNLLIMGQGESAGEDKIREFHEGLKLAALVATRLRNVHLVIESPKGTITFCFKKPTGFQTDVLHARIDAARISEQFVTTICNGKAVESYNKMFLPQDQSHLVMIPKTNQHEHTRIYSKSVFIGAFQDFKSRYHWNLSTLKLNRDRNIPNMYSVKIAIQTHLDDNMTQELATELLRYPDTEEARAIGECTWLYNNTKQQLKAAFVAQHGEQAVLQSEKSYTNIRAIGKSFKPVQLPDVMRRAFSGLVPTADEVVSKSDLLEQVDNPEHRPMLAEIAHLMDLLDIPAEVRVYADREDGTLGHAEWSSDGKLAIVWLNESLMAPGHRTKRIRAALHELAHIEGRADDETWQFEHSLDAIAATLAVKLLN